MGDTTHPAALATALAMLGLVGWFASQVSSGATGISGADDIEQQRLD